MINIDKPQKIAIDIAAFFIPAIIAYLSHKYGFDSNALRILYAAIIGAVFCIPVCNITQGANAEFRKTAPVYDKVRILLYIIAFPIVYLLFQQLFQRFQPIGKSRDGFNMFSCRHPIYLVYNQIHNSIIQQKITTTKFYIS